MPLTTVTVSIAADLVLGTPLPLGTVRFELTGPDVDGAIVAPQPVTVTLDANGLATVALWPNARGTQGTQYRVTMKSAAGELQLAELATVPASSCYLHDILNLVAPAVVDDAQAAALAAQGYASQAGGSAGAAAASKSAVDTAKAAVDVSKAAIDTTKGQIDQQETNVAANALSVAQSVALALAIFGDASGLNAAQQIMLGYANTAQAQASAAAASALSAASVAQQDLSAVTAQALHRSPGAIVALVVDDTSKHSDGGAWIDRVTGKSWMTEAFNGTWLSATSPDGWQSELDARSKGATLGTEASPDASFASSAGWTLNGSAGIAGNKLTATAVTNGSAIATRADATSMALATAYQVTVVVDALTAGAVQVRLGNTTTTKRTLASAGTYIFTVNPGATGTNIGLYASGATSAVVSRFSVKPVTANATATGDYFQLATDGKFYSLNASSGTTEVFRGNKAKYPRMAGIVVEGTNVTIYDLAEPGRPMWMRFSSATANALISNVTLGSVAALNGMICVGSSSGGGLYQLDFIRDSGRVQTSASRLLTFNGNIGQRNSVLGYTQTTTGGLASQFVNAVAMMARPTAPIDPVTQLPVPTIGVAVGTGNAGTVGTVLMDDGTAVNYSQASNDGKSVAFTKRGDVLWTLSNSTAVVGMPLATANVTSVNSSGQRVYTAVSIPANANLNAKVAVPAGNLLALHMPGSSINRFDLLRENPTTQAAGLMATITGTYNTGWMTGDIRRAWCIDTAVEALSGPALNTANYVTPSGLDNTTSSVTATGFTTSSGTAASRVVGGFTTVIGRQYRISWTLATNGGAGAVQCFAKNAGDGSGTTITSGSGITAGGSTDSFIFTATSTTSGALWVGTNAGFGYSVSNINIAEFVADRSVKAKHLAINGTIAKTAVATAAQAVFFSGWSAVNYLQEAYSSDLDYGTAAWSTSAWVSAASPGVSASLIGPYVQQFTTGQAEKVTNGTFDTDIAGWTSTGTPAGTAAWDASGAILFTSNTTTGSIIVQRQVTGLTVGSTYAITGSVRSPSFCNMAVQVTGATGNGFASGSNNVTATVGNTFVASATTCFVQIFMQGITASGQTGYIDNVSIKESLVAPIIERAAATGAYWKLGMVASGAFVAEAYDGTTTRRVTSTAAFNNGTPVKPQVDYDGAGALTLKVNGSQVAQTTGAALLTLNNATAVATVGIDRALAMPFPGSIALLKTGATVPLAEQAAWMYAQERAMFNDAAQVTLADSGSVPDLGFDDMSEHVKVVTAANESSFLGLVRVSNSAVPAGSYSKARLQSGVKLTARGTTNPGVDITFASQNLKEELLKRAQDARLQAGLALGRVFDFDATASQTDFALPVGWETSEVLAAGASKREGAAKDWQRKFNGFYEATSFNSGQSAGTWVQLIARKAA